MELGISVWYSDRNMRTTPRGYPEYSGVKKPKRIFSISIPTEISGSFGIMESNLDEADRRPKSTITITHLPQQTKWGKRSWHPSHIKSDPSKGQKLVAARW